MGSRKKSAKDMVGGRFCSQRQKKGSHRPKKRMRLVTPISTGDWLNQVGEGVCAVSLTRKIGQKGEEKLHCFRYKLGYNGRNNAAERVFHGVK